MIQLTHCFLIVERTFNFIRLKVLVWPSFSVFGTILTPEVWQYFCFKIILAFHWFTLQEWVNQSMHIELWQDKCHFGVFSYICKLKTAWLFFWAKKRLLFSVMVVALILKVVNARKNKGFKVFMVVTFITRGNLTHVICDMVFLQPYCKMSPYCVPSQEMSRNYQKKNIFIIINTY